MGGVGFILAYEAEGFTLFLEKRHIFKATGGTIMGGRMETHEFIFEISKYDM